MAQPVIDLDISGFLRSIPVVTAAMHRAAEAGEDEVADEVLRLSQKEVPKDEGTLEGTGVADRDNEGAYVGYNTPYAARQHEHLEYAHQKGRKAKYLEDPIKLNTKALKGHMIDKIKGEMKL